MGHARTDTTRLYDRRGESAKRAAASTISVPYVRPGAQRASELEMGDEITVIPMSGSVVKTSWLFLGSDPDEECS